MEERLTAVTESVSVMEATSPLPLTVEGTEIRVSGEMSGENEKVSSARSRDAKSRPTSRDVHVFALSLFSAVIVMTWAFVYLMRS